MACMCVLILESNSDLLPDDESHWLLGLALYVVARHGLASHTDASSFAVHIPHH